MLRSTFASKTSRNPPLCAIEEERLDLVHPDAPPDQCTTEGFSPSSDTSSTAGEPVGGVTPPQGLTAATPFAQSSDTFVPDGAERLSKQIPPAPPTVQTTPFSVDALKLPSVQAEEDSPTLSKRIGQEPHATSGNVREPQQRPFQANASPPRVLKLQPQRDKYLDGCRTEKTAPPVIRSPRNRPPHTLTPRQ